jgi:hypothetical protein
MFLKKVYRYNKWLCGGMLFFIVMQLFVFYRSGMVFSPWFNYGMYSAVIKPEKEDEAYKVYAGNELLAGIDFTPQQWDRIHFTLLQADAASCNENFYDQQISRLFRKFHLVAPGKNKYINTLYSAAEIKEQYPARLANALGKQNIQAVALRYIWDGNSLVEKDSLRAINSQSFQCK